MTESHGTEDAALESLIGRIADEFDGRCKRGEQPSIEDYAQQYPDVADVLREILPALQALKPAADSSSEATVDALNAANADLQMTTDQAPGDDSARKTTAPSRKKPPHSVDVPNYEILGELGRGGMGVVYKARQISLNRLVALKMIRAAELANEADLERFRNEALAVAKLKHPNIVEIYEVNEHEGLPYFSLEYVEGGSLDSQLKGEPQPPKKAAAQVIVLAEGMQAAHAGGLVHRDLKPANVLIASDGRLKITDFGLVKRMASEGEKESGLTQTGAIVGTPSYMAPEQAGGQSKDIGPAADIYALGAILYDMITGRPPFKGTSVLETIQQVRTQDPVPPRQLQPGCPRDLETICLKCLQKETHKRYASAADFAGDLQAFLQGMPIKARPVAAPERFLKWMKRHPAITVSVFVVLLAAASVFGIGLASYLQISNSLWSETKAKNEAIEADRLKGIALGQRNKALQGEKTANKKLSLALGQAKVSEAKAVKAQGKAEDNFYWAQLGLSAAAFRRGDIAATEQLLVQCPADRRQFVWHHLKRQCQGALFSFGENALNVRDCAVSPNNRHLAVLGLKRAPPNRYRATVALYNLQNGELLKSWEFAVNNYVTVGTLAFDPSGSRLAAGGESVKVYDLDGNEQLTIQTAQFGNNSINLRLQPCRRVAFSSDGKLICGVCGATPKKSYAILWNATTGKQASSYPLSHYAKVVFSPDNSKLAYDVAAGEVRIAEAATGATIGQPIRMGSVAYTLAFAPRSRRLAINTRDAVRFFDAATGKQVAAINMNRDVYPGPTPFAISPDGDTLGLGGGKVGLRGTSISLWSLKAGVRLKVFHGYQAQVPKVLFTPDSKRFICMAQTGAVKVWAAAANNAERTIASHLQPGDRPPAGPYVHLSGNGKSIAQLVWRGNGAEYTVRSVGTGRKLAHFRKEGWRPFGFDLSPDGKLLTASNAKDIVIWERDTGKVVRTLKINAPQPPRFLYSPNRTHLALAVGPFGAAPAQMAVINLKTKAIVKWRVTDNFNTSIHGGPTAGALRFSPDGKRLAVMTRLPRFGSKWKLTIFSTAKGKPLFDVDGDSEQSPAQFEFSPDGKWITVAVGYRQPLFVYNAATGTEMESLRRPSSGNHIAFSKDSRHLAFVDKSGPNAIIQIINLADGTEFASLQGQSQDVTSLAFHPSGTHLATGGGGTVRIWSIKNNQELISFENSAAKTLAFSPDGNRLVAIAMGTTKVWDGTPMNDADE